MNFHRTLAHTQLVGDHLVGFAGHDQVEHLALAVGQAAEALVDLGVLLQGTPEATLTASGPIASDPGFQQDLARATLIGCSHIERNGHHYVDGMAAAPPREQLAFLAAHPDVYRNDRGTARLAITGGQIAIGSLDTPGLGSAVLPDTTAMTERDYQA